MIEKTIELIDENTLRQLVVDEVAERRDLEFKRDLPGTDGEQIREFLADVTSLANSSGGDLVFGIEDREGVAANLTGVDIGNVDEEILRLEQIIRNNVDPRLIGIQIRHIPFAGGKAALIVRVPRGIQAPHRVTYRNSGKFYARTSRGKYELDVHELRHAFIYADRLPSLYRQYHAEAIERARGVDMPFAIRNQPTAVVSTIPLSLLRQQHLIPITENEAVLPKGGGGYSSIEMMEGVMLHSPIDPQTATVRSFAITYRSGRTDVAWIIGEKLKIQEGEERNLIFAPSFEEGLIDATSATQSRLRQFGIEGPWVIQVSVYGIKDFYMVPDNYFATNTAFRNHALIGEIQLDVIEPTPLLALAQNFWLLFGERRPENRPFGKRNGG